jgi:hypothetical protein
MLSDISLTLFTCLLDRHANQSGSAACCPVIKSVSCIQVSHPLYHLSSSHSVALSDISTLVVSIQQGSQPSVCESVMLPPTHPATCHLIYKFSATQRG